LDFLAALDPVLLFAGSVFLAGSVFFGLVSGMLFFFVVSTIFCFNSPCLMDSGTIGWIGMIMKRTAASVFKGDVRVDTDGCPDIITPVTVWQREVINIFNFV